MIKGERQILFWLAALVATVAAIWALKDVLLPFVVGMVLAYALNPIAAALVRRGLSRTLASALVVALIVVALGLVLFFLVPLLVAQIQHLAETLPATLSRLKGVVEDIARDRLGERFGDFKAGLDKAVAGIEIEWSSVLPMVLRSAWTQGLALVNFLSLLLITPLVVFYLLVDWQPMMARVESWLPRDSAAVVKRIAGDMDAAVGAFIRGQGMVCLILGIFYAVALTAAGLRYGLLIGLATGLLSFVPFVGWALGLLMSCLVVISQSWPELTLLYVVIAIYCVGQALDAAYLSPRIVGSRVGLHPLWLIFALFVFSYAMGFVGMLVAVPLAASFAVLVRYALEVWLGSEVYRGRSADRAGGPPAS